MKKILFVSVIILIAQYCIGQTTTIEFDHDVVKQRIKDKVEDYQYQLKILSSKNYQQTTRYAARDAAKNLFMRQGGYYNYPMNGQTYYDKCEMETVNKNRPNIIYHKLVKTYLDVLAVTPYQLSITATKDIVVDGLKKIDQNQWQAVAHIGQKYVAGDLERPTYIDITYKDITVFIDIREDEYGVAYIIRLEDCKVTSVTDDDIPVGLQ